MVPPQDQTRHAMTGFFLSIYRYFARHRTLAVLLLCLTVLLAAGGMRRIRLQEDIAVFLPDGREDARLNAAYRHMVSANRMVVSISLADSAGADADLLVQAADDLAARLQRSEAAQHLTRIRTEVDMEQTRQMAGFVLQHLPIYLTDADYETLAQYTDREHMAETLENTKRLLTSPAGAALRPIRLQDPLGWGDRVLAELQSFRLNDAYRLYDDHLFTQDLQSAVLVLESRYPASETARNAALIDAIGQAAEACCDTFAHRIRIVPAGAAYIARGNASRIRQDSLYSMLLALMIIIALLFYYFRHGRYILLILIPIGFGFIAALGLIGMVSPDFSVIAIGIGAVMFGIAVNYPLHFLSHRNAGYDIEQSLQDVTEPLTTGNITTIGAFLSLLALSAPAMHHFGMFAAFGLFGTILCVLIWLPHWTHRLPASHSTPFAALADWHPERQRGIMAAVCLLTVVLYFAGRHVGLNPDMQQINYMEPEQRQQMERMLQLTQGANHVTCFVADGATLEEALTHYETVQARLDDTLTAPDFLGARAGIGRFLPSQQLQAERIARWQAFWADRREAFLASFEETCLAVGFRPEAFRSFTESVAATPVPQAAETLEPIYSGLAADYIASDSLRTMVFTMIGTPDARAAEAEAWLDGLSPHAFAFDAGTVTRRMVRALSEDFDTVLLLCGGLVFICLLLVFGSLELSLTAFLPLVIAWIWILGIMAFCGMEFNIVTIMLATFIFGMGDDYTIFMIEGMMYEYTYQRSMMRTYKSTVILSALIMLAGIGALVVARHPAMQQLGRLTFIGMTSVVLMAYIVPTCCYRWLTVKKGAVRRVPVTLRNYGLTVVSFIVFFIGAAWLNLVGFWLLGLRRKTDRRRMKFHEHLCNISRFIIRHIPSAPASLPDTDAMSFDRPTVIIANHQSHLDLMAVLALTPRIVVVTNRWAWRSPFYGTIIRYADFCPIDDVLADDLHDMEAMIRRGYSVMLFPEGTRTADGKIGRFHQGAFYLARKFHLEIRPLLLHGFHEVLPKYDLLLRPGHLTVRWLQALPDDPAASCRDMAHAYRRLYEKELSRTAAHCEDAVWFMPQVRDHYLYKPAFIVRTVRRFLRTARPAAGIMDGLPHEGRLLVHDAVYGAGGLWTALLRQTAQVDVCIPDAAQYDVAVHCHYLPPNLHFIPAPEAGSRYDAEVRCKPGMPPEIILSSESHA
ncbi:MAG: 1-acyl-sn-glycerol-3-phosphate acyltransferase [Bacteroidales bacterium]|nr:1-acyl-sn-glycerol-3-phosphate acyltransferase [Bacteroidales bacterium]